MAMQWYIIHTYSGFEKKVKESLESRVAAFNLQDKIGRVLIPMEDTVEVASGRTVDALRMSYPGMCWWRWTWTKPTAYRTRARPVRGDNGARRHRLRHCPKRK